MANKCSATPHIVIAETISRVPQFVVTRPSCLPAQEASTPQECPRSVDPEVAEVHMPEVVDRLAPLAELPQALVGDRSEHLTTSLSPLPPSAVLVIEIPPMSLSSR